MSNYEAWRISFQSSEQAARAAFDENVDLRGEIETRDEQIVTRDNLIQRLHADVADSQKKLSDAKGAYEDMSRLNADRANAFAEIEKENADLRTQLAAGKENSND